jgi:hypothetical protein
MNRRRKIFLLVAGFTGLVLAFFVVLYFSFAQLINSESIREKINAYLTEKAGASVRYGNSEYHLFPFPELTFHKVNISIPDKAEGSISALRVYPDLWSFIRGRVRFSKAGLEAPHFTYKISEETEKLTLKDIEEKVRSVVRYLASTTPGLHIAIRDGKLDLIMEDKTAYSFDLIQSQIRASEKAVDIKLTSRSSLWDNLSISSSIKEDGLKSTGSIRLKHLRPDALISRISKETAGQLGVPDADLVAKFAASGLTAINASIESSVPELVVTRGKKRGTVVETKILSDIKIEPETLSISIKEAKVGRPALILSGLYTLDRNSGVMTVGIEGKSIAVASLRKSALEIWPDIPLIRSIFTIVQGGEIPDLHFQTTGKSLDELGWTKNIRIAGKMRAGVIYIESRDLTFQNVAGDVIISRGILEGSNVVASLGNHRVSGGKLRVGLKGDDAPFHLDTWVKADAEQLPALLTHKHLLKSEAVLHEVERVHDVTGSAEGRLVLGERLDSIHVKIAVDKMNIAGRYEPLPFPLAVTAGKFFLDENTLGLEDSAGSIGGSAFSGLTARVGLDVPYDLEVTRGRLSISADEIFPWITSFKDIRPVLKDVASLKGTVSVSSINLRGPLYKPNEWKFHADGEAKELTLDASFLPGKAEKMSGTFAVTENELAMKNMQSKIIDSLISVTGSVREFPSDIRSIDFALQGEIGPKVSAWAAGLAHLPPKMKVRAPFSLKDAILSIEKERSTTFSGGLLFGQGTEVSFNVTKTPDSLTVRDLKIKDRGRSFEASVVLTGEAIDASFKGTLTPRALNAVFEEGIYSDASLEGDFRTHIVFEHPRQSTAGGRFKGENIHLPWDRDIPLVLRHIKLEAKEQGVAIDTAELSAGEMMFRVKGTLASLPEWFALDLDVSSGGIDWETLEKMLRGKERRALKEKPGFLKDLPLRGSLKLRSDYFRYRQFKWEPLYADLTFDGKTLLIAAKKAALCGISTTGTVGVTEQGLKIDIALSAKGLAFEPTVLCLTDKRADFTGTFQMEGRLRGEGKIGEIAGRLDGSFVLTAKDGKILRAKSLDRTLDLLNESENFKGQFPDLDREIISYSDLTIHGAVREHRVRIEEGVLEASHMGIMARGYIDLANETVDLNAFVSPFKTVRRIVRKIPVLGHVIGGSLVSVPVKISGNLKDPQITFLSLSAIGSETLGIIERIFKLPITLVEPIFPARNENK